MTKRISELSFELLQLIKSKQTDENQIIFGVLLIFFQHAGRFPSTEDTNCINLVAEICHYLNLGELDHSYIFKNITNSSLRTARRFKNEIRSFLQFKEFNKYTHLPDFIDYCKTTIFPLAPQWDQVLEQAYTHLKNQKIEPCSHTQLNHLLATAHHQFETDFFEKIEQSLSSDVKKSLDQLIKKENKESKESELLDTLSEKTDSPIQSIEQPVTLGQLKEDQAHLKIKSI